MHDSNFWLLQTDSGRPYLRWQDKNGLVVSLFATFSAVAENISAQYHYCSQIKLTDKLK